MSEWQVDDLAEVAFGPTPGQAGGGGPSSEMARNFERVGFPAHEAAAYAQLVESGQCTFDEVVVDEHVFGGREVNLFEAERISRALANHRAAEASDEAADDTSRGDK